MHSASRFAATASPLTPLPAFPTAPADRVVVASPLSPASLVAVLLACGPLAVVTPAAFPVWSVFMGILAAGAVRGAGLLPDRHDAGLIGAAALAGAGYAALTLWWTPSHTALPTALWLAGLVAGLLGGLAWARTVSPQDALRLGGHLAASVPAGLALAIAAAVTGIPTGVDGSGLVILSALVWPAALAVDRVSGLRRGGVALAAGAGLVALAAGRTDAAAGVAAGLLVLPVAQRLPDGTRWGLGCLAVLLVVGALPVADRLAAAAPHLGSILPAPATDRMGRWSGIIDQVLEAPILGHGFDAARALLAPADPPAGPGCPLRTRRVTGSFTELSLGDQGAVARTLGHFGPLGERRLGRHLDANPDLAARWAEQDRAGQWDIREPDPACVPQPRTAIGPFAALSAEDQAAVARTLGFAGPLGDGRLGMHLAAHPGAATAWRRSEAARRWPIRDPGGVCVSRLRAVSGGFGALSPADQAGVARALGYDGPLGQGGLRRHLEAWPAAAARWQAQSEAGRWEVEDRFCPPAPPWWAAAVLSRTVSWALADAAAVFPPMGDPAGPANPFLQIWFDLGELGAAAAVAFLLWLVGCIGRLAPGEQAYALALFAAGLVTAACGHGPWDVPWTAGLTTAAVALAAVARGRRDVRNGAVLVVHSGDALDFVLLHGVFAAIRRHHAGQRLVFLGDPRIARLARASGLFRTAWDGPARAGVGERLALRRRLRGARVTRAYDLTTDGRGNRIFPLFAPGPWPEWSGTACGGSHPTPVPPDPQATRMEALALRLAEFGIVAPAAPDVSWLSANVADLAVPASAALFVVAASGRSGWTVEQWGALARDLAAAGHPPVLIGGRRDSAQAAAIRALCPAAIDLCGRVGLPEMATLARLAAVAVGFPSGLLRLAAAAGCPAVVLPTGGAAPLRPDGPSVVVIDTRPGAPPPVRMIADAALDAAARSR